MRHNTKILCRNGQPQGLSVLIAENFFQRAIGLLLHAGLGQKQGMLITPCASVHTMWMRFSIDVIFLDGNGKILRISENLAPFRFAFAPKGTKAVVELAAHNANHLGLALDDRLTFD